MQRGPHCDGVHHWEKYLLGLFAISACEDCTENDFQAASVVCERKSPARLRQRLERDAALAADLVREAALMAARIRQEGLDVERKTSGSDIVTQADTAAERLIVQQLTAERPDDWRRPWPDWPGTRYEAKAARDERKAVYLTFQRLPDRDPP